MDYSYNTIRGFSETGVASKIRKATTDFGSGWLRKLFGGVSGLLTENKETIIAKVSKSFKGFGTVRKGAISDLSFGVGITKDSSLQLITDLKLFKTEISRMYGGKISSKEWKALRQGIYLHEMSEAHILQRHIQAGKFKGIVRYGTHESPAVIGEELLLSAALGKTQYQAIKKMRSTEIKILESMYKKAAKTSVKQRGYLTADIKYGLEYVERTRKITKQFEKKFLPRFKQKWNGMAEKGWGARLRKLLTDFGSPWQGGFLSKKLANMLTSLPADDAGKNIARVLRRSSLGKAAKIEMEGTIGYAVGRLGKPGATGEAFDVFLQGGERAVLKEVKDLPKGSAAVGASFLREDFLWKKDLSPLIDLWGKSEKQGRGLFWAKREAMLQRTARLEAGKIIPEVYSQKGRYILMEHAGESIEDLINAAKSGQIVTKQERNLLRQVHQEVRSYMEKTFSDGSILNHDIHLGNITVKRTSRGFETRIIDFGGAIKRGESVDPSMYNPKAIRETLDNFFATKHLKQALVGIGEIDPIAKQAMNGIKRNNLARLQNAAQLNLAKAARNGGKQHRQYKSIGKTKIISTGDLMKKERYIQK